MSLFSPPSAQSGAQKPPFIDRAIRLCGLDYRPPVGFVDNVKESFGIVGSVRNAVRSVSRWGGTKR